MTTPYENERLAEFWNNFGKDWEEWSLPEEELPEPHSSYDWNEAGLLSVDPQINPARPPVGLNSTAEMLYYITAEHSGSDVRLEMVANAKSFGDFAERLWRSYMHHYNNLLEEWLEEIEEADEDGEGGQTLYQAYMGAIGVECADREVFSHFCLLWRWGYISDEAFQDFLGYIKNEVSHEH